MIGEDVGLSRCVSNNGLGVVGISSGDSAGESVNSGDSAGELVNSGDSAGELDSGDSMEGITGITGEAAGEGDTSGEVEEVAVARVSISSFIPWLQCPNDPQMKYLFPGEARGMVVAPSL